MLLFVTWKHLSATVHVDMMVTGIIVLIEMNVFCNFINVKVSPFVQILKAHIDVNVPMVTRPTLTVTNVSIMMSVLHVNTIVTNPKTGLPLLSKHE